MSLLPFGSPPTPDASSSKKGKLQLTGDLGNTAASPQVVSTHLSAALPINQGGTGNTSGTATINANLTGPITSSGNATSIANSVALPASPTTTTQAPADNSTKIATTAYVDNAVLGQRAKEAVKYASIAALPTVVYANGSSGVGATITGFAFGALSLDSAAPSVADRVLIKNQASDLQNGIYVVTATGSAGAVFILTRATDFDQASDIQTGDTAFVTAGTTLANTTWAYTGIDSPTMGTTSLTFAQVAGPGSFTGGNGITITGTSIAINTAVTADLSTSQALTNKTYNGNTFTSGTGVLTIAASKTLTASNTLTLAGTDGKGINVGAATSGKILVGDGSNMVLSTPTFPNASATSGKVIKSDGTNWAASTETYAAPGTSGNVMTSDGTNWTSAAAGGGTATPKAIVSTDFAASGRYTQTLYGSGNSTTYNATGALLDTSATSSSGVNLRWRIAGAGNGNIEAGSPMFSVNIMQNAGGTDFQTFFGLSNQSILSGSGATYTAAHIGFKLVCVGSGSVNVYGTQANGATETATSSLVTITDNDVLELIFIANSTTSVDYYWRKNGGALSSATNLTTNLPTGLQDVNFGVSNAAHASGTSIYVQGSTYQR